MPRLFAAHQHSAGAAKTVAIRRSAGRGWAEHENPRQCRCLLAILRLILTGGQVADVTQAALVCWNKTTAVTADKGYDSDELVETIRGDRGACQYSTP